jgi:hypothetical protein
MAASSIERAFVLHHETKQAKEGHPKLTWYFFPTKKSSYRLFLVVRVSRPARELPGHDQSPTRRQVLLGAAPALRSASPSSSAFSMLLQVPPPPSTPPLSCPSFSTTTNPRSTPRPTGRVLCCLIRAFQSIFVTCI